MHAKLETLSGYVEMKEQSNLMELVKYVKRIVFKVNAQTYHYLTIDQALKDLHILLQNGSKCITYLESFPMVVENFESGYCEYDVVV